MKPIQPPQPTTALEVRVFGERPDSVTLNPTPTIDHPREFLFLVYRHFRHEFNEVHPWATPMLASDIVHLMSEVNYIAITGWTAAAAEAAAAEAAAETTTTTTMKPLERLARTFATLAIRWHDQTMPIPFEVIAKEANQNWLSAWIALRHLVCLFATKQMPDDRRTFVRQHRSVIYLLAGVVFGPDLRSHGRRPVSPETERLQLLVDRVDDRPDSDGDGHAESAAESLVCARSRTLAELLDRGDGGGGGGGGGGEESWSAAAAAAALDHHYLATNGLPNLALIDPEQGVNDPTPAEALTKSVRKWRRRFAATPAPPLSPLPPNHDREVHYFAVVYRVFRAELLGSNETVVKQLAQFLHGLKVFPTPTTYDDLVLISGRLCNLVARWNHQTRHISNAWWNTDLAEQRVDLEAGVRRLGGGERWPSPLTLARVCAAVRVHFRHFCQEGLQPFVAGVKTNSWTVRGFTARMLLRLSVCEQCQHQFARAYTHWLQFDCQQTV